MILDNQYVLFKSDGTVIDLRHNATVHMAVEAGKRHRHPDLYSHPGIEPNEKEKPVAVVSVPPGQLKVVRKKRQPKDDDDLDTFNMDTLSSDEMDSEIFNRSLATGAPTSRGGTESAPRGAVGFAMNKDLLSLQIQASQYAAPPSLQRKLVKQQTELLKQEEINRQNGIKIAKVPAIDGSNLLAWMKHDSQFNRSFVLKSSKG
jgi:hypothetical protein